MLTRVGSQLLVVGVLQGFGELFEQLEGRGYRFESVADTQTARTYLLRQAADVVLLRLPADEPACRAALEWMRSVKQELPVVVVSEEADIRPYLTAMECGAFDYFTSYTPLPEMLRVLANAVRWHQRTAA